MVDWRAILGHMVQQLSNPVFWFVEVGTHIFVYTYIHTDIDMYVWYIDIWYAVYGI